MKAMVCEMCGSHDLIKKDGFFVCESCGTKYDPEEAKKLLVEVSGQVEIDNSERVKNLYTIARRASDANNHSEAYKAYSEILVERPNDWEAAFYSVYHKAATCRIVEIPSAAMSLRNNFVPSIELVTKENNTGEPLDTMVRLIEVKTSYLLVMFAKTSIDSYLNVQDSIKWDFIQDLKDRMTVILDTLYFEGDVIKAKFGTEGRYRGAIVGAWSQGVKWHIEYLMGLYLSTGLIMKEGELEKKDKEIAVIEKHVSDIRELQADYEPGEWLEKMKKLGKPKEKPEKSGGCYVATAVYGSYDCPEVWTLRRFRDCRLARSFGGRLFIKAYYRISPKIVKRVGDTVLFGRLFRGPLDWLVARCKNSGLEDTPYEDRSW